MFALSQRWRWIGMVALLTGLKGCGGGNCETPNPNYDPMDPLGTPCLESGGAISVPEGGGEQGGGPGGGEFWNEEGGSSGGESWNEEGGSSGGGSWNEEGGSSGGESWNEEGGAGGEGGEEIPESAEPGSENGLPPGWKVIVKKDIPIPEELYSRDTEVLCKGGIHLAAHDLGTNRPWFRILDISVLGCEREDESDIRNWYAILHEETTSYDKDKLIDGKWQIITSQISPKYKLFAGPLNMWAFARNPNRFYRFNREKEVFEEISLPSHPVGSSFVNYHMPYGSELISGVASDGRDTQREGVDWVAFTGEYGEHFFKRAIVRLFSDNQAPDVFELESGELNSFDWPNRPDIISNVEFDHGNEKLFSIPPTGGEGARIGIITDVQGVAEFVNGDWNHGTQHRWFTTGILEPSATSGAQLARWNFINQSYCHGGYAACDGRFWPMGVTSSNGLIGTITRPMSETCETRPTDWVSSQPVGSDLVYQSLLNVVPESLFSWYTPKGNCNTYPAPLTSPLRMPQSGALVTRTALDLKPSMYAYFDEQWINLTDTHDPQYVLADLYDLRVPEGWGERDCFIPWVETGGFASTGSAGTQQGVVTSDDRIWFECQLFLTGGNVHADDNFFALSPPIPIAGESLHVIEE